LAVLVLALSAYAGSGYLIFYAGYGIGIFSFISTFWFPAAYNKYAHLVLECLGVIFWLSTFAALAVVAAAWDFGLGYTASCYGYGCYKLKARSYDYHGPANATKAAAALGAIEWALFIGTLITYGIYLHRHRRGEAEVRAHGVIRNAVVEEHKMGPVVYQQQPVQQPVYAHAPVDARYQQVNMA
jgi:hypothetical protein